MFEEKTLRELFIEAICDEFAKRGVNTNVKNLSWDDKKRSFIFESEPIIMTPRIFKTLYIRSSSIYYEETKNKNVYKVTVLFDYRWEHFDHGTNGTYFVRLDMYVDINPNYPDVRVTSTY